MAKEVRLDETRMKDRKSLGIYMQEIFGWDEAATNLDALYDNLSEVSEDVDLIIEENRTKKICADRYSFLVLRVLGKAADENPHIHIKFREALPKEEPEDEEDYE